MKTSAYLEQALFFEQSPVIDQFFEAKSSLLFEPPGARSFVRVYVQSPLIQDQGWDGNGDIRKKNDSKPPVDASSVPPSPVDWHRYCQEDPPTYVGTPGLALQDVSDPNELTRVAHVSSVIEASKRSTLIVSQNEGFWGVLPYMVRIFKLFRHHRGRYLCVAFHKALSSNGIRTVVCLLTDSYLKLLCLNFGSYLDLESLFCFLGPSVKRTK